MKLKSDNIFNILLVIVGLVGGCLYYLKETSVISKNEFLFNFVIIVSVLISVNISISFFTGKTSAKGVAIERKRYPYLYYIVMFVNFFILIFCVVGIIIISSG